MGKTVNKVTLLGNVGSDPEVKFLPGGQATASLSIATADRIKEKGTENWVDRTEWHNVVAYGRTAEIVRDYVKRGAKVYIEGRLTTRSWDDKGSGKNVYRTEVVIAEIVLLSGREGGNSEENTSGVGSASSQRQASPADAYAGVEITDDDIPF